MRMIYFIEIPSKHIEIAFSGHVLARFSVNSISGREKPTRQCSWWNTDTIACCSGKE
jgi:hypothetical protein